jgi:hypothetical protein
MERPQLTFPLSDPPGSNGSRPTERRQTSASTVSASVPGSVVTGRTEVQRGEEAAHPSRAPKAPKPRKASGARKTAARKSTGSRKSTPQRQATPPAPAWERFVVSFGATAVRVVAAAVSYEHMRALAAEAGEGWRSWLLPISVDGLAVVALVTIRRCRRLGLPADRMAWLALGLALVASLAANVAAAVPTPAGRLVAAWPPAALLLAEVIHRHRGTAAGAKHVAAPVSSNPAPGGGG